MIKFFKNKIKNQKSTKNRVWLLLFFVFNLLFQTRIALSFSADSVNIRYQKPFYIINIYYTIPNLKEKRQAQIRFHESKRKKIKETYIKIISGADFYFNKKTKVIFREVKKKPTPW